MRRAIEAILSKKPSEDHWFALCAALEGAEKSEIAEVERILEEKGWPDGVRVAPSRWLEGLLDGQAPLALRLARVLALSGDAADGELLRQLLRAPEMRGICGLNVSYSEDGNAFLRVLGGLREFERMRFLSLFENGIKWKGLKALLESKYRGKWEEFTVRDTLGEKGAEVLASADLAGLRVLGLRGAGLDQRACEVLAKAPWIGDVERLDISENGLNDRSLRALFEGRWSGLSVLWADDAGLKAGGATALADGLGASGAHLRELSMCGNPLGEKGVRALLGSSSCEGLRILRLAACGVAGESLRLLGRGGREMELLDLSENQLGAEAMEHMVSSDLAGVEELLLDGHALGEKGLELLGAWSGLAKVRFLGLDGGFIGDAGAKALSKGQHLRGVRFLRMDGVQLGEDGLRACLGALDVEKLEGLALGRNPLGDCVGAVFEEAGAFPCLRELWLPAVEMTVSSLKSLGKASLGGLLRLGLSGNSMDEASLTALLEADWLGEVEELGLRSVGLSDAGLKLLAQAKGLRSLRVVDLAENDFGDKGLEALKTSSWARTLKMLDVSGNVWGDRGEQVLTALWQAGCEVEVSDVEAWNEEEG
ncbi:MAG: hypothetical protein H6727_07135 [Myxococcales bacterium]|nr:hypothetical protein [Myxococcales bacterium]